MKLTTVVLALALAAAACAAGAPAAATENKSVPAAPALAPAQSLPADDEVFYGVYLNGHKVGWMKNTQKTGATFELGTELQAQVGGLGRVSGISLTEIRRYDPQSGKLASLSFSQGASTGAVKVEGKAVGEELVLTVTAGAQTTEQRLKSTETVHDALALWLLAKGKVGDEQKTVRFDPSVLKPLVVRYKVSAKDKRLLAGVDTDVLRIDADYPDLGVQESSWVDTDGRVLETRVGGFFIARIEPPEVAKRLDYSQDILVSAVVKTPTPLGAPDTLKKLRLTFEGFGEQVPPSGGRQKVERRGAQTILSLSRDNEPKLTPLPPALLAGPATTGYCGPAAEAKKPDPDLVATPFIQCDAAPIRDATRTVLGDATDVMTASNRLVHWVFDHIRDEYVPAYSNALEALTSARGDCTEHSVLFVAMARAAGIPARQAVGIGYWPPGGGFGWHAWAEIRVGTTWIAVDPTWDQPIADVTHVKLAAGDPAEQARIVMLLGQLKIVEQTTP